MASLTAHQRQVLLYLIDGLSLPEIARRMEFGRQRCQEYIDILRTKGFLSEELPADCTTREMHVQDTKRNPWPPPARYARTLPGPDELIVRSCLPPRSDGLELPAGLPDERVVILSRPGWPSNASWSFVASRRGRWSVAATTRVYDDWASWATHVRYEDLPQLSDGQYYTLTQVVAWAIGVEAILYNHYEDSLTDTAV